MKTFFEFINKNILYILGISIILIFILIIFISPNYLIYDEVHYYPNTELLKNSPNGLTFIKEMKGPVGPLPNYIQFIFGTLFSFNIKFLRLVNLFLIISTSIIPSIYFFLTRRKKNIKNDINLFLPIVVSFSLPFTWPITGMALTEAASVFFTMLSLVFISIYIKSKYKKYLYLFFSSFATAIASIGRQTLIVLSPILLLYVIFSRNLNKIKESIIYLIVSLSLPIILFFIWGGIVPQDVHGMEHISGIKNGMISIKGLLLSIGYLGFGFLFVCPSSISKIIFTVRGVLILIISIIINFVISVEFTPIKSIINYVIKDENIIHYIDLLFPVLSLYFGIILFVLMYERVRKQNIDVIEKISWMMIIMVIISNAAITYQFSSRYVAVGLAPLIIIGTSLSKQKNMIDRFGNISGIFFGLMSLCSYYFF